ncbi:MAG TPA: EamA family transporter [Gaiellaceae bacterium]|nr:EamA family transporter [Gaiellaceae bacterium]
MRLATALATVYVVWGSTYLAIAVAERTLPPLLMLSVRFVVAGGLLYAWCVRRGHVAAARPGRREWLSAAVVGALLLAVETGLLALAEKHVETGLAALLVASVPLFMAALDRVVLGVRIAPVAGLGILTGLAGVAMLAGHSGGADPVGVGMILAGALAWTVGSMYARRAPQPRSILLFTAMQMLAGGVELAVFGFARGEAGQVHLAAVSTASWAAFAYLVFVGAIFAYTAYGWLLKHTSTPVLTSYAYVNPGVAVFLGWALAGEHVGARELVAGFVILTSVALLLVPRRKEKAVAAKVRTAAPATVDV